MIIWLIFSLCHLFYTLRLLWKYNHIKSDMLYSSVFFIDLRQRLERSTDEDLKISLTIHLDNMIKYCRDEYIEKKK